ncbi:MAG: SdpI family protein [Desulfitobacteriaceae bacterium]|nr:SdpI family protein [Desulfitobacteriaceae bacterium]MDD4345557.1 SdpI family protein [Desulfitobacteriaceae bacterium]MDD4401221.1 SdpI family protein [Desulfitobacteriaceae bacterium]
MTGQASDQNNGNPFKKLTGLSVLATLVISFWAYPRLPYRVPSHWNVAGEIDGYSSAFSGAFLLPLITLAMWLFFLLIPLIDPRKDNYKKMGKVFWLFSFTVILFLCLLHLGILMITLGMLKTSLVPLLSFAGIGVLFIVIGFYMGKIKHNYFFGIRTPWTLASEEVWNKTHRTVGPWWVVSGVIFLMLGFLPKYLMVPLLFIIIVVLALGSAVYSYIVYRSINR